ncbi:MAG: YqiJ family protein [Pseudomonadota bacterium]
MLETFFLPAMAPFAVAIGLMLMLAVVELIGALMGMPASAMLDSIVPEIDADIDVDLDLEADYAGGPLDIDAPNVPSAPNPGALSQVLGWLCVGKVPVLVLFIVFLTAFGLSGFVVQSLAHGLAGAYLPSIIAAVPAFAAAVPATRIAGLTLSKIMPKEQTEAVSQKAFIGKVATIVRGEARKGVPAEAKLTDGFGQTHYVLVEPDEEGAAFPQGADVIIVRQSGSIYQAIANTSAAMSDDVSSVHIKGKGGENA